MADKLAKILGRLGSEFEGERAAAGLLAAGIVRESGMPWSAIIHGAAPAAHVAPVPPIGWRDAAMACRTRPDLLTEWEREFVATLPQRRQISAKQARILSALFDRVRAAGRAA